MFGRTVRGVAGDVWAWYGDTRRNSPKYGKIFINKKNDFISCTHHMFNLFSSAPGKEFQYRIVVVLKVC